MVNVVVKEQNLISAANEGMDAFIEVFVDAIKNAIGGELTATNMAELNASQITLLAYHTLREEVMDGGFIQLIHNGYGGFIFLNPFAAMMRRWGLGDLCSLINKCHKSYKKHREVLEAECSDEEFMALFEKYPEFDDFDDKFVEYEEYWTTKMAEYVDEHIAEFAVVES